MAAKIVRQPNKIALLGVPTSAAAMSAGHEARPQLCAQQASSSGLQSIGYRSFTISATTHPSFTSLMKKVPAREILPAFWPRSKR